MSWTVLIYLFCFLLSFGISLSLTPWMATTAGRIGLVDRPDGNLKTHDKAVPYMGGLAVFIAFLVGFSPFYQLDREVLAILLGATLVLLLGFMDDLGNLPPATKLLGQSLAILIVLKAGVAIKIAFIPPILAYPLSFLWLLGLTNAFNLIDIMDGLSAGVGAVACLFLFVLSFTAGQTGIALMTLALLGATLGFLRYNSPPAMIYMGDAGSLFIGFMLGALSMVGVYTRNNPVALLAPVLILGVPIFDTLFVMLVRWQRGIPVMMGSPDHFALRLRRWKLSIPGTVAVSYLVASLLGAGALVMVFGNQTVALAVMGFFSFLTLVVALWLRGIDMTL
ncbi:undecaprenyl/decaprenyl-phosphate alpha-N-acetylglucosaminyl 1-phosphate transferase [bacterium]|nr:MAG: undecaprenyl/decaprenyl-phosphate alpha-N-acetylglucosaminyl 1-phosphate transferase [bacterium]